MSINFSTVWDSDYWMQSNGMYCGFNMPEALVSKKDGEAEFSQGLPPYNKRKFYLSDEYPAVPKNWVPSEGRKTSYFVPVKENQGMWLDFNKNCNHKYEVAIVISVQGINPITGMPCKDAGLEQYIDTCPKHNIKFGPHRYCEKCDYKWPKQNYICTTGTPNGNLWLDGFRTADGVVRQYILTMDKIKGVAANILKEERVFAVGISFFLSVNPKPVVQQTSYFRSHGSYGSFYDSYTPDLIGGQIDRLAYISDISDNSTSISCCTPSGAGTSTEMGTDDTRGRIGYKYKLSSKCGKTGQSKGIITNDSAQILTCSKQIVNSIKSVNVKKVEIGAGANIDQQVCDDPEPLEFWRKEPESLILINYCLESDCEKILSKGKISLEGHKESFLKDIPTGNEKKN